MSRANVKRKAAAIDEPVPYQITAKTKEAMSKTKTCKTGWCVGSRDHYQDGVPCPAKGRPYAAPPREASPVKKAMHKHVATLVAEARATLELLERAVAYEGTEYSEMAYDLRETRDRVAVYLRDAIACVPEVMPSWMVTK